MKFSRTDQGDETVLEIDGSLDALTAPEIRPTIDAILADERKHVTLELSALQFIDSSGVAVIVSLFKRTRAAGGEVRITGLRDQPRAIFRLLRLDRVFPVT